MRKIFRALFCVTAWLLVICLAAGAFAEKVALVDPANGVLEDEEGMPMSYSSLLTLLAADSGSSGPRTLIDYGTPLTLSQFLPDTGTVSDWQIVSRAYESGWQVTDEIARRKSVSPTGNENEFEIVLEVCAPMSWEEFLKSQVYRQSQNPDPWHSKAGDVFLSDSQPAGENANFHGPAVIKLGSRTLFTTQWWLNSGMQGTGWMYFVGDGAGPIQIDKLQFSSGGTVEFDITPLANVFQQSENEVRAFCVSDPVPAPLIFENNIYTADGTVNDGAPWHWHSIEYRSIPGLYGGKPSYMRVYTYSYRVKLDTTDPVFVPDTAYYTNGTTTLEYTFNDDHRYINFDIPQVMGKHYSVSVSKVDDVNQSQGLEGAEFKLFHADKTTPFIPNGGTEQLTYVTDASGNLVIDGISCGIYYLQETRAPEGYIMPEGEDAWFGPFSLSYAELHDQSFTYPAVIPNVHAHIGKLVVSKTVSGGGDSSQSFVFHVVCTCPENEVRTYDLDLHAGESRTIAGIPAPFTYSVTEDTSWSWRYSCSGASRSGTVEDRGTGTAAFTNTYSEQRWEGDTADARNVFNAN